GLVIAMFFLAVPALAYGFDVTAQVSTNKMTMEDTLSLRVVVTGGKARVGIDAIKDFQVISQGTSTSINIVNSQMEKKAAYQYALVPLKKGDLVIPPLKVTLGSKVAYTVKIDIKVLDRMAGSDHTKAFFAKAKIVDPKLFVGQQTLYNLQFYAAKQFVSASLTKPQFAHFEAREIEGRDTYSQNINGISYRVTEVNYVLTAREPGGFDIEPASVTVNVVLKETADPFFDSFFSSRRTRPVRVASEPIQVEVAPLPPFEGGKTFSGLVGIFKLHSFLDKTRLPAGDSATLTIEISGIGNVMDVSVPELNLDEKQFKIYNDSPVEKIQISKKGIHGTKTFKKAIVPVEPGRFDLPPVSLNYFDVNLGKYTTVTTTSHELMVDALQSNPLEQVRIEKDKHAPAKEDVTFLNKDILDIKEGLAVLKPHKALSIHMFSIFMVLPLLLFVLFRVTMVYKQRDKSISQLMAEKARGHLKRAKNLEPAQEGYLSHLYSGLVCAIFAKARKKGEALTVREAREILGRADVEDDVTAKVIQLLESIESCRFSNQKINQAEAGKLFLKTQKMVKTLGLILLGFFLFTSAPQKAFADYAVSFLEGVKQYKNAEFEEAAKSFEKVVQQGVRNPELFYDIGNAYLKNNDIGRAILWYERSKLMAPNDPDLNFNLGYANSLVIDKKEEGTISLKDILFFFNTLIPFTYLQIFAIFWSFVFFVWAGMRVFRNKKVFSGTGAVLCAFLIFCTATVLFQYFEKTYYRHAVIIKEQVPIRSGMGLAATKLFDLHAGTKVRVEDQRKGYIKIFFSKGKIGWVKEDDAHIIEIF
ncbi:MAG: hypothetical protein GY729_21805, partial [Desulfobacteraceae bacterium]|nr:hypothetical protein [Desulfobacteraceae bacterium]